MVHDRTDAEVGYLGHLSSRVEGPKDDSVRRSEAIGLPTVCSGVAACQQHQAKTHHRTRFRPNVTGQSVHSGPPSATLLS